MEHGGDLITTIALGLSAAFIGGFVARRFGVTSREVEAIAQGLRRRPDPLPTV